MLVVCDIDGTIADNRWRQPPTTKDWGSFEWHEFFVESANDPIIKPTRDILFALSRRVLFVTARREEYRVLTERWLKRSYWPERWELLMRPNDNFQSSADLKIALLEDHFGAEVPLKNFVLCAFEDNSACAAAFRARDIPTYQITGFGEPL